MARTGPSQLLLSTTGALAVALAGCNLVGQVQAGPLVGKLDQAIVAGGELDATSYLDLRAGDDWIDCHLIPLGRGACGPPPERASRAGVSVSAYVRGSNAGFGVGVAPGLFAASTDATKILLAGAGPRLGLETLRGTAFASAGGYARITAGVTLRKTYDQRALLLCRSLTYLTFTLQGTVDDMPAAASPRVLPAVSLLVGVAGLDDSGAASDKEVPGSRCPR